MLFRNGVFLLISKMRMKGILKCLVIIVVDIALLKSFINDWRIISVIMAGVILYAFWLGEAFSTAFSAIKAYKLDAIYQNKLVNSADLMLHQYEMYYGKRKKITFYLIPDDSQLNAFCFGRKKIGVTSEAVNSLDGYSLAAVLSHEMGHIEGLDVCVRRLLLSNMLAGILILGGAYAFCVVFALIIAMMVLWLMDSWFGFYLSKGIFKGFLTVGKAMFNIGVVSMQSVIAFIGRRDEFAADGLAVKIGFGPQLAMVLERYIGEVTPAQSLRDVLYATHPKTRKRIARIEKQEEQQQMNYLRRLHS